MNSNNTFADFLKYRPVRIDIQPKTWKLIGKYSDNVELLQAAIERIGGVTIQLQGIGKTNEHYQSLDVSVVFNGFSPYVFHFSHNDSRLVLDSANLPEYRKVNSYMTAAKIHHIKRVEFLNSALYSLLCDIGATANSPTDFEEFFSELGYNVDSISDNATFHACMAQRRLYRQMFTQEELDVMPS